jgi:hypothetical protein
MKLRMGGQIFQEVTIPLLWGRRAVVQHDDGALSVIDLAGPHARSEIVADLPAAGVEFLPDVDGFTIRSQDGESLYRYNPRTKVLSPIGLKLPEIELGPQGTRIGTSFIGGSMISGFGVGIAVQEDSVAIGAPLPPNLADLIV